MDIEIEKLRFSYDKKEILKEIDLKIKKGKLTGILGPNGCGKSTLLKNILGYLDAESGSVKFNNKNMRELKKKEIAKIVSLVPQKSSLMTNMSVEEFVLLGRLPHLKSPWHGYTYEDKEYVKNNLKLLNLENFSKRVALSLSGGEFQRVLLARALTQDPKILLLDEPTSALDLNHAVEMLNSVKNLIDAKGLTGIVVLHDLNLASMFCDEIIMMKNGKVKYQGAPEKVITENNLKEIYNLKAKIMRDEKGNPYVIPLI